MPRALARRIYLFWQRQAPHGSPAIVAQASMMVCSFQKMRSQAHNPSRSARTVSEKIGGHNEGFRF
jgi:hypothetical protein